MSKHRVELQERISTGDATVGVIGLGYVGLPLALAFDRSGFNVLGFDTDDRKVDLLNRGESYIEHLDESALRGAVGGGGLSATSDFRRLKEPDVLVICVPTPLTGRREPDLSYVMDTSRRIAEVIRPGQLVVLESTTFPGTTEEVVKPTLEKSGLECGREFFLAYSPEREDPGNPDHSAASIPKIVGGVDEAATELAVALYSQVVVSAVRVADSRIAEASKLTENIFRAVNIALVNELKVVFEGMGIDIWDVLDAASTKPFGFMRFNPGPGWGGHCIPVDPFYLSWKARQFGQTARFIELAGEVNIEMPRYVVAKIGEALADQGKRPAESRVLILGLAYKKDVGDPRESPAFEVLSDLLDMGVDVAYHDPHIPSAPSMRSWEQLPTLASQPLTPDFLASCDVIVVVTDHSAVDYEFVLEHARCIVDTRGVYRQPDPRVIKA